MSLELALFDNINVGKGKRYCEDRGRLTHTKNYALRIILQKHRAQIHRNKERNCRHAQRCQPF